MRQLSSKLVVMLFLGELTLTDAVQLEKRKPAIGRLPDYNDPQYADTWRYTGKERYVDSAQWNGDAPKGYTTFTQKKTKPTVLDWGLDKTKYMNSTDMMTDSPAGYSEDITWVPRPPLTSEEEKAEDQADVIARAAVDAKAAQHGFYDDYKKKPAAPQREKPAKVANADPKATGSPAPATPPINDTAMSPDIYGLPSKPVVAAPQLSHPGETQS